MQYYRQSPYQEAKRKETKARSLSFPPHRPGRVSIKNGVGPLAAFSNLPSQS